MTERILCVSAHGDDETLGCGGTLAKHVEAGDTVMVIILADGVTSRDSIPQNSLQRRQSTVRALRALGVQQWGFGDWPDQKLDTIPRLALIKDIEVAVGSFQPSIVYTHWSGDRNIDHRIVSDATMVACRPQPGSSVKRVLMFEAPSSTEWGKGFEPSYWVDISGTLKTKMAALECYAEEMRPFPHPRSMLGVEYLAKVRGAAVGVESAEAFMVARVIV